MAETITRVSVEAFNALVARVEALEQAGNRSRDVESTRAMTDDDAINILNGELAKTSHREAAEKLGLSYGQIYSCRGEYTFKHVHRALKEKGFKNPWVK